MANIKQLQNYLGEDIFPKIIEEQIKSKANVEDVPTKVSQLENDSQYITKEEIGDAPIQQLEEIKESIEKLENSKADKKTVQEEIDRLDLLIESLEIPEGQDVRPIIDALDKLKKEKADKTEIPVKVSELENDVSYITQSSLDESGYINQEELNEQLQGKANTSDIPSKLSELQNDTGFVEQSTVEQLASDIEGNTIKIDEINNTSKIIVTNKDEGVEGRVPTNIYAKKDNTQITFEDYKGNELFGKAGSIAVLAKKPISPKNGDIFCVGSDMFVVVNENVTKISTADDLKAVQNALDTKVSTIEKDVANLTQHINSIKEDVGSNEETIASIQSNISKLQRQIDTHNSTIESLEAVNVELNKKIVEHGKSINSLNITKASKDDIPTKVSQLENDKSFVTETTTSQLSDKIYTNTSAISEIKTDNITRDEKILSNTNAIKKQTDNIQELDTKITNKANINHTHDESEITVGGEKLHEVIKSLEDNLEKTINKDTIGKPNGIAPLDDNSKIDLSYLPDLTKQQIYIVSTTIEMNELSDMQKGDRAYITELGDSYIWDGEEWLIMSKAEWENINLDWNKISNAPIDSSDISNIKTIEDKADKSDIPTKLSELTNDSGYVTAGTMNSEIKEINDIVSKKADTTFVNKEISKQSEKISELDNAKVDKSEISKLSTLIDSYTMDFVGNVLKDDTITNLVSTKTADEFVQHVIDNNVNYKETVEKLAEVGIGEAIIKAKIKGHYNSAKEIIDNINKNKATIKSNTENIKKLQSEANSFVIITSKEEPAGLSVGSEWHEIL